MLKDNILVGGLPTHFGKFKVDTNFRKWVYYHLVLETENLNDNELLDFAIDWFFGKQWEDDDFNVFEAFDYIVWFYSLGEVDKKPVKQPKKTTEDQKQQGERILCYQQDAIHIYSAFLKTYNIDLNTVEGLHWWKFQSLLIDLDENTQLKTIIKYRSANLSGLKGKEKKFYQDMKRKYRLKPLKNQEELDRLNDLAIASIF